MWGIAVTVVTIKSQVPFGVGLMWVNVLSINFTIKLCGMLSCYS